MKKYLYLIVILFLSCSKTEEIENAKPEYIFDSIIIRSYSDKEMNNAIYLVENKNKKYIFTSKYNIEYSTIFTDTLKSIYSGNSHLDFKYQNDTTFIKCINFKETYNCVLHGYIIHDTLKYYDEFNGINKVDSCIVKQSNNFLFFNRNNELYKSINVLQSEYENPLYEYFNHFEVLFLSDFLSVPKIYLGEKLPDLYYINYSNYTITKTFNYVVNSDSILFKMYNNDIDLKINYKEQF